VTPKITVEVKPSETGWVCEVTVVKGGSTARHMVSVRRDDLERWGRGGDPETLIRRSFEFLLAREPKESILRRFDLGVIRRYFPEYDGEMR